MSEPRTEREAMTDQPEPLRHNVVARLIECSCGRVVPVSGYERHLRKERAVTFRDDLKAIGDSLTNIERMQRVLLRAKGLCR